MNQCNISYHKETNLYTVEIKGVRFTFSDSELETLGLLIHKMRADQKPPLVVEVETDERGHDLQCSSSVGFPCDCFRNDEIRTQAASAMKAREEARKRKEEHAA